MTQEHAFSTTQDINIQLLLLLRCIKEVILRKLRYSYNKGKGCVCELMRVSI